MTELKPCPFCGGEARFKGEHFVGEPSRYWIECHECPASMEAGDDMEKTIEAWNTRAERTCRDLYPDSDYHFGCSECGYVARTEDWFRYCPRCGRRVTDDRQDD